MRAGGVLRPRHSPPLPLTSQVARLGAPFTELPSSRDVAAAGRSGDDDAATAAAAVGKVVGRELRAVGIDMNLVRFFVRAEKCS